MKPFLSLPLNSIDDKKTQRFCNSDFHLFNPHLQPVWLTVTFIDSVIS